MALANLVPFVTAKKPLACFTVTMRTIATMWLWGMVLGHYGRAQMSVNPDWRERTGLTVASSETIAVPAKVLRGFVTLESVDVEPRMAIKKVRSQKTAAIIALKSISVPENLIKTTATCIPEWEATTNIHAGANALLPATDSQPVVAVAHVSFDILLVGMDSDELAILPHDTCKRLRSQAVFENSKIYFLFVGELTQHQVKEAFNKAYKEARANALSAVALSGRSLGKLEALTPERNGAWGYWSKPTYGYWDGEDAKTNPLSNFVPADNEVYGNDASKLSRNYSIELRFNIE
jgi:hypothetical protein